MTGPWHVLIHQIPTKPLYLRIKVRKCLLRLGAVALKDSVYVVPARQELLPSLQEIAAEVRRGGGVAHILEGRLIEERDQAALVAAFNDKRAADYESLARDAAELAGRVRRQSATTAGPVRARMGYARRRLAAIERIDFFGAPSRAQAVARVAALGELSEAGSVRHEPRNSELVDRTWVTRRGIQVDRIACAWFVRRFVDSGARFRFLDPAQPDVRPGEIAFDMVNGDFTHEADRCSFETLIFRTETRDAALARVAEIVHEMDIKDGKYSSPETKGVQQMLAGMLLAHAADEDRLDRGFAMLDDLYQSFRQRPPAQPAQPNLPPRRPESL